MSDKLSKNDFNYASVDSDTASKLEYFVTSGKAMYRKHEIQFMAEFGQLLSEARDLLSNHKNGTFIKWATAEFDISHQTVWNYVNAWDRILSNGLTIYLNWSQTAVYLASSKELPPPVIKKLERLPSTGIVRACDVKKVIEAAKPKPEPKPEVDDDTDETADDSTRVLDDEGESHADQIDDVPFDAAPEEPAKPQASIMLDSLGKQIPQHFRAASELAIQLQSTGRELDKYRKIAKDFAEQPGGEWICVQDIDAAIRTLKGHFQGAQYHTVCPRCNGKGCERCSNVGYLPEHRKNIL